MKKFTEFLSSKGFYIALGVGIVAFVGLMAVYNYDNTRKNLRGEQAIDLNQPVQTEEGMDISSRENRNDIEATTEIVDQVISNDAKPETTEVTTEETTEEQELPVISDAAGAQTPSELEVALNYNGEETLAWPLVGSIIVPFSMDTTVYFETLDVYRCNPGMLIKGEEGDTIYSVFEGVVKSVEETKDKGTVVTIDLGNGYEAVYGQLMNVKVSEGEAVSKAQPLAEVGIVSSYYEKEGDHLYFEMSKDGAPLNPIEMMQ